MQESTKRYTDIPTPPAPPTPPDLHETYPTPHWAYVGSAIFGGTLAVVACLVAFSLQSNRSQSAKDASLELVEAEAAGKTEQTNFDAPSKIIQEPTLLTESAVAPTAQSKPPAAGDDFANGLYVETAHVPADPHKHSAHMHSAHKHSAHKHSAHMHSDHVHGSHDQESSEVDRAMSASLDRLAIGFRQKLAEFAEGFHTGIQAPSVEQVAIEKGDFDWQTGNFKGKKASIADLKGSYQGRRLQAFTESQLKQMLVKIPEINVYRTEREAAEMLGQVTALRQVDARPVPHPSQKPMIDLISRRPDLKGLPLLMGDDCRLAEDEIKELASISSDFGRRRRGRGTESERMFSFLTPYMAPVGRADQVPALMQILTGQTSDLREILAGVLSRTYSDAAIKQLAKLAIFDLSARVRDSAIDGLREDVESARPILLAGLRYPWAPVSQHAAEALVRLDDKAAIKPLINMLDMPDPTVPVREGDEVVTYELVKINHMRNCILCHPSSTSPGDTLRARVPYPNRVIPVQYYQSRTPGPFVRADQSYVRQDFSATLPVVDHGEWPLHQRHDFVVRRKLKYKIGLPRNRKQRFEVVSAAAHPTNSLQRQAILFALRELSGKNPGDDSFAWREDSDEEDSGSSS